MKRFGWLGARRGGLGQRLAWAAGGVVALAAVVSASGIAATSCAQTPTNVPVQTMEQPRDVAVVCLKVFQDDGGAQLPAPQPELKCNPVPVNTSGAYLPNHLYALVTQETRGEVAVVDLTAGAVVDIDPDSPGVNFLPVGRLPTDVSVTPDGQMAFVGSADPNSPAIFALPTHLILGDSQSYPEPYGSYVAAPGGASIPNLTTWPVCALPQAPSSIEILPLSLLPSALGGAGATDAGAADASSDAGAGSGTGTPTLGGGLGYVIIATLPGDSVSSAKVVVLDPAPFFTGAGVNLPDGGDIQTSYPKIAPGSLARCPILAQYVELKTPPLPSSYPQPGPAWSDGVPYADGGQGIDLPVGSQALSCASADAGSPVSIPAPQARAGATALDTSGLHPTLYVADVTQPIIHVIDLSDPTQPVELAPLQTTNIAQPARAVTLGPIAVSPPTSQYQRFLYAVDKTGGGIMVYDITDPVNGPKVPLTRPHPELDPFLPPDRILFGAPVASVSFVRHDWPLAEKNGTSQQNAQTGLICNPNPNVDVLTSSGNVDLGPFIAGPSGDGAYYRWSNTGSGLPELGPARLRGVFAFATLSNGNLVAIDVDDWDAPCRRPDPMIAHDAGLGLPSSVDSLLAGPYSAVAPPEPVPGAGDYDPYHAPITFTSANTSSPTSLEWYFPSVAPHRVRSNYLLETSAVTGSHAPYLQNTPLLTSNGDPVTTSGVQGIAYPSLVATDTHFVDPLEQGTSAADPNPSNRVRLVTLPPGSQLPPGTTPNVRFAWEDPQVQTDQDWAVTYEGPLPGFVDSNGYGLILANVEPGSSAGGTPNFDTAVLTNPDGLFCEKGIEDFALGQQRARAENAALGSAGLSTIPTYEQQVADYVQLVDYLPDSTDAYWGANTACWNDVNAFQESLATQSGQAAPASLVQGADNFQYNRSNFCINAYGQTLDPTTPNLQRDFPILEAYDGKLVVGRFAYAPGVIARLPGTARSNGAVDGGTGNGGGSDTTWGIVGADPSNDGFLETMQCCFHAQVHFNVRTGGVWSAWGSTSGFMHHVIPAAPDGRCTPSCEARDVLLNGRAPPVPRPAFNDPSTQCAPKNGIPSLDRNSLLAFRNPMFSFLIWNGLNLSDCTDAPPSRDMAWRFHVSSQYTPLSISLANSGTGLSPQSMLFIDSLGQLAIVDGESQGLILVDLGTLGEAHTPYQ
ncbi:MAG TPA: hypothetical protein VGI39_29785 [Polyangiaceae bacterium]|jgi:hypothetical protein